MPVKVLKFITRPAQSTRHTQMHDRIPCYSFLGRSHVTFMYLTKTVGSLYTYSENKRYRPTSKSTQIRHSDAYAQHPGISTCKNSASIHPFTMGPGEVQFPRPFSDTDPRDLHCPSIDTTDVSSHFLS